MKALFLAVIVITLLLGLMPAGAGAQSSISPLPTPFVSPIGTPCPTAVQLRTFGARKE